MKKIIPIIVILGVIAAIAVFTLNKNKQIAKTPNVESNLQNNNPAKAVPLTPENKEQTVKEFSMESFVEFVDGKPKPQFSLKEITVNKGDLVRIKITVTKGTHDFKIDEFNVYADTKELNKEYAVEFTADKAGEFVYYCAKPGHRTNGHWGTLKVVE